MANRKRRTKSGRPVALMVAAVVACLGLGAAEAGATDTIYVDLSGIDGMAGLTADQKQQLKDCIIADIWANFFLATDDPPIVTGDPAQEAGADRVCRIKNTLGTHTRKDGTTGHHYGGWPHGSKECDVHIKNFTDRHGDDYKSGDPPTWDINKLCTGIARTAAHELAHSYSVGHNENESDPNKMTEGGLVDSESRANEVWIFDEHTGDVLDDNMGKPPCASTADYDADVLLTEMYDSPDFPHDPDEVWNFDAAFEFFGPLTPWFDLGWYGVDSDGGALDGNPEFDFIKKTTMLGTPRDARHLTFFTEAHDAVQFVLRGREDSPFAGQWHPMSEALILPGDFIVTPSGKEIFRQVMIAWDIDGLPGDDVRFTLNANMAVPPFGAEFNGWTLMPPPCAGLVPWFDSFDQFPPGIPLHGQCGWKGWGNDPALDAVATDFVSLSPPMSVDIQGGSDLVHELSGAFSGTWAFTAWQWIPGDFDSGPPVQFAGSYFVLLNTYEDPGPYNWSVQMNFDSNDGMLKVYYGNGLNTVNVPYMPERWVEIKVVIDLDDDLTRIIYDGMPIVEYSWTGGVLGEGGGALDIAAVDLYANGSTSIFYDDLSLEPVDPCPGDVDGDGFISFSDLLAVLSFWGPCTGCPEDIDGDGDVGFSDLLTVLSMWGECP